jgi:hypothetical protein
MSTPPPLSPAAQAVFDAYQNAHDGEYIDGEWIPDERAMVAAAIRAVADQVAWAIPDDCSADVFNRQLKIRSEILAIADELDGTANTTETANVR